MKLARSTLLSAAGVILALSLASAQAGSPEGNASPGGAGTAMPQAGGGESAGAPSGAPESMGESKDRGGESMATEGGAEPGKAAEESEGAEESGKAAKQDTMPSEDKSAETSGADKSGTKTEAGTKGTAAEEKAGAETEGEAGSKTESKAGMDDDKPGATAKGEANIESKSGVTAKGGADVDTEAGATAEGKAGKSVRLESEQVGKVKTYFSEHKPSVTAIDKDEISVSVGIALPGTVALYDLPPDIIVVEGACPIKYFVWGDDIVLVDSCSREVVEIIVGVA
jgi:hypothetical protein